MNDENNLMIEETTVDKNKSLSKLFEIVYNFKIDKKFWYTDHLTGEDYDFKRSKPAPYIKTAIKIAKLLGLKKFVEIGSTRFAVSQKCTEYFNKNDEAFLSPPCCCDGHCGFFFADNGFDVTTVDIDENCKTQVLWSYENLRKEFPTNVDIQIPVEGIDYLKNRQEPIDILFLDGWDKGTPNYAEKHLEAFESAKHILSKVHLILIDDTDYITHDGGKDKLLSPHLLSLGYIPLFNGRQTLFLNTLDVEIFEENLIVENNMNFDLDEFPKVILSLSTTPVRLLEDREGWGVRPVIEKLISLSYPNYEVHFNVPYISHKSNEEYVLPEWIKNIQNDRLKIFRCHDYGAITKLVPTLCRTNDEETIIITVDDDIEYMDGFIEYHLKKRKFYPDSALGFAGLSAINGSCHFCTTLKEDTEVKIVEGYKTFSYKRGFFKEDFFDEFLNKSWNDDIIISAYLGKHKIKKIIMNYYLDEVFNPVVESFPIGKVVPNEKSGCNLYRANSVSDNTEYFSKLGYFD